MRASITFLLATFLLASALLVAPAAAQTRNTLDIYLIDVEGGNATLFVSPSGQSLLMDTGNVNGAARDAGRIAAAAKDAGLTQIDHLITTHWHGDHFGGMTELVKLIPVKDFMDHGPNARWPGLGADVNGVKFAQETYPGIYAKGTHTIVKAGDKIPLQGMDVRVIASNGEFLKTPLQGAGAANPFCPAAYKPVVDGNLEDGLSIALYIGYGKFRSVQPGDLLQNQEIQLMCPKNPVGTIDVLLGLHHGQAVSNSTALIHALHPRMGVMNNGTRKGGEPPTMMAVHSSPGFEDLWQLHSSLLSGQEYTQPGMFIANVADDTPAAMPVAPMAAPQPGPGAPPPPAHNGQAYWIKVSARSDGSFTVTNPRNNFSKTYAPR
jgi:beta-lactamase superfamily II metal-dependent hydrolase